MTAKVFEDNEKGYLVWLKNNQNGFVLNTHKNKKKYLEYLTLHKATCRTISKGKEYGAFTERGYTKVCANSQAELLRWIEAQGGERFQKYML